VYTRQELNSRYDILLENYCKVISIEAHTMLDMVNQEILPAILAYSGQVARDASAKRQLCADLNLSFEQKLVHRLAALIDEIGAKTGELEQAVQGFDTTADPWPRPGTAGIAFSTACSPARPVDEAETIVDKRLGPFPGYGELLTTK
jgi:glutamine synthetase